MCDLRSPGFARGRPARREERQFPGGDCNGLAEELCTRGRSGSFPLETATDLPSGKSAWAHVDLNHGPHPYQGCALTGLSYGPQMGCHRLVVKDRELYRLRLSRRSRMPRLGTTDLPSVCSG